MLLKNKKISYRIASNKLRNKRYIGLNNEKRELFQSPKDIKNIWIVYVEDYAKVD